MKKIIKEILIYLLMKVDEQEMVKMSINHEIVINWKKIIPLDNKWYHFASTTEMWIKRTDDGSGDLFDSVCIYKDGMKVEQIKKLKDLPLDEKNDVANGKLESGYNFEETS